MTDEAGVSLQGGARPGIVAIWIQASRAWTLGMPFMCVTVGSAAAILVGRFSFGLYLMALAGTLALQAGANMVNDYSDYVSGTDSADWQAPESFGPSLVIQRGFLKAEDLYWGGVAALIVGSIFGLELVYLCGWPVLVLGAIGVAAAYFYTGAPLKLAYRGLGDLMVFAFMGPGYILGAYYVQTLSFTWTAAIASLPMGLLCSSLLQANNLRDIESDARSGKRTMAVMLGRQNARIELILSDMAAYAAVLIGVALRLLPWPALAVLVTLPRAIDQVRLVSGDANAEMHNRAMTRSGQLQFEFGLLLVAAFIVSYLFGL